MGLFWDLLQQSQISDQKSRANSIEQRLDMLERKLYNTQLLVNNLIQRLEEKFGEDIDGDGKVG